MAFGESRLTTDIDVVVDLSPETLRAFCEAFPPPAFYVSDEGARVAATKGGMFNIIHADTQEKIDVIVPADEHDRVQLTRVIRRQAFPGREASFAAPEDTIIKKMEY